MLSCGEREAMVMAPPPKHDSAVLPCFHGCLASLHRHFPPQSPPSHPLDPSLHCQQQPSPWDCPTIPKLQLLATAPSRRPMFLPDICMAAARTVWFSFSLLPQISCYILSLKCFSSDSDNCPAVGIRLLLQFPHPQRAVSVLLTLFSPQFLCPTKFCMVLYILFHWSSTPISWCSTCTSVSEGVSLMYPWRMMYSMASYSSAILFSAYFGFLQFYRLFIFNSFCYFWLSFLFFSCWSYLIYINILYTST